MPQRSVEKRIGTVSDFGIIGKLRYYYYLPIAFVRIWSFALRVGPASIKDVQVLLFLAVAPLLYLLGFKGKLGTPLGRIVINSRDKISSTAYGTFKTQFSYVKELGAVLPGKHFFPVVVDVGANIGDFTLAIAGQSGRVIAIEPGENNFASLTSNLKLNGIQNATALNVAAHDQEEQVRLAGTDSMLHVSRNVEGGSEARGMPLGKVLEELKTDYVDLLMIDVQGHERKVLDGMADMLRERRVGVLAVEVHPVRGVGKAEITSLMSSYGYSLMKNDDYIFGQAHLYYAVKPKVRIQTS